MSDHSTESATSDAKIEITPIVTTIDLSGRLPLLVAAIAAHARTNTIPTYPILGLLKSAPTGGRSTPDFILDVITCEISVRGILVELVRSNHTQSLTLATRGRAVVPRLTIRSASDLKQFRYSFAGFPGHQSLRVGDTALVALAEALDNRLNPEHGRHAPG